MPTIKKNKLRLLPPYIYAKEIKNTISIPFYSISFFLLFIILLYIPVVSTEVPRYLLKGSRKMELKNDFDQYIYRLVNNPQDIKAFDSAIKVIVSSHVLYSGKMRKKLSKIAELSINEIKQCEKMFRANTAPHSEIANNFIRSYGETSPIGTNGQLWSYNLKTGLWEAKSLQKIAVEIGKKYVTHSKSVKHSDYKSLSNLVYDETLNESFFKGAVKGINTPNGFYVVENNSLICRKSTEHDKTRFMLNIGPQPDCDITEFTKMLQSAFGDTFKQQNKQLRMFFGLSLLGLQSSIQKVCFLMGVGGSGKSTILRILEALVPLEYVSHVSPLDFDSDYKKAALADKLLNLVPEIDKDKVIPSADFKMITGDDEFSARQPYGRVFNLTSEAGNWFNGNFYITTKDHSDAFYRRWAIIKFLHAKPENERDPMLTKRIIKNELPGILAWAFEGVKDYLSNGLYLSSTHEAAMKEWKIDGNSTLTWLRDDDNGIYVRTERDSRPPIKRTAAYKRYTSWCYRYNKKPFSKKYFYLFLEENGVISSVYNGNNCFTGLTYETSSRHQGPSVSLPF